MRYTVNGKLPYYSSIQEARKAAIQTNGTRYVSPLAIIAFIINDEGVIIGSVHKSPEWKYHYWCDRNNNASIILDDGRLDTERIYPICIGEPNFVLWMDESHSFPSKNIETLCKMYVTLVKSGKLGQDTLSRIRNRENEIIGAMFTCQSRPYCKLDGKIYEIRHDGKFGKTVHNMVVKEKEDAPRIFASPTYQSKA